MAANSRDDRYLPYTTKRARQACENCRSVFQKEVLDICPTCLAKVDCSRKKSKCSGEKPECSFCVRLRQTCVYARYCRTRSREQENSDFAAAPLSNDSNRLSVIEGRLERLTAALEHHIPSSSGDGRYPHKEPSTSRLSCSPNTIISPIVHTDESSSTWPSITQELQLPEPVIVEGIERYFSNYCNLPCPILAHLGSKTLPTSDQIPPIILYPMLALSLRSISHPFLQRDSKRSNCLARLSKLSWDLLSKAYADFDIDDGYFQGLCLLAQADFGDGRVDRAQAQIALGLRLAQGRGMMCASSLGSSDTVEQDWKQEVVWSLFMLDRMLIGRTIQEPAVPASSFELPILQGGPLGPSHGSRQPQNDTSDVTFGTEIYASAHSVVALNVELIRIWQTVLADIIQAPPVTEVPFWRHDSPRAAILTKLLDFEIFAGRHSYTSTGPPTRVLEEPHLRDYFCPWLHFQLVHSVIHCCLNHPFIIFIKTSRLKSRVPLTFLQKSYEHSMIHANWVFKLLTEMENAGLELHDPFLGYLVAIAASIHLEHTLSKYPTVASSAKRKFDKCFEFVKRASEEWPNMRVAAWIVERLRARLSRRSNMNYVEDEYDGAVPRRSTPQISLEQEDEQLMWKLFDYASMSATSYEDMDSLYIWNTETTNHESLSETNKRTDVMDIDNQDCQYPASLSSNQTEDPHLSNMLPVTAPGFETLESCSGDWSLFGRPWLDYFPLDGGGMNYS